MGFRIGVVLAFVTACGARTTPPEPPRSMPQLARYMRETMNVPFSFAMTESESGRMSPRVTRAAVVLQEAAKGLRAWKDLPGQSDAARAVFLEYAKNLEKHVDGLQSASVDASYHLEAIRQACNACHRAFRPGNRLDVLASGRRTAGVP